jgi:hypothetical protein
MNDLILIKIKTTTEKIYELNELKPLKMLMIQKLIHIKNLTVMTDLIILEMKF